MRILKYIASVVVGLLLYVVVLQRPFALALVSKAAGGDQPCPWSKLITLPWTINRFQDLQTKYYKQLHQTQEDPVGIVLFESPTRPFWIKKGGSDATGQSLLGYVLAEQQWLSELAPERCVRKGDVVVDVGAHIGTFGDDALRRGASKVIMVEPDPINLECIRRNFKTEIADGRVIVVPEGAWDVTSTMDFDIAVDNSLIGSLVYKPVGAKVIQVPVRPLDDMLRIAGVDRVDFLKMDIEGAERHALKGAAGLLGKWKPRIMLDAYHLPDDAAVLPGVITAGNPAYRSICAACSFQDASKPDRIVPYSLFYE